MQKLNRADEYSNFLLEVQMLRSEGTASDLSEIICLERPKKQHAFRKNLTSNSQKEMLLRTLHPFKLRWIIRYRGRIPYYRLDVEYKLTNVPSSSITTSLRWPSPSLPTNPSLGSSHVITSTVFSGDLMSFTFSLSWS